MEIGNITARNVEPKLIRYAIEIKLCCCSHSRIRANKDEGQKVCNVAVQDAVLIVEAPFEL
jgi:hypothetical protein